MISKDDIDAFAEGHEEALSAAETYLRRARKGIPPDRWTDGADGARMVAQGIMAMQQIIDWQNDALLAMMRERAQTQRDAMSWGEKE